MTAARTPFLTAEWRHLVLVNFHVPPALLQPLVPRGTELDTHDGHAFISLVGFRFLNTRVLGWRIPFHEHFDEINLRFYVRRAAAGEVRRAVTFVREIVPRRAIALVARALYNEPYTSWPMRSHLRLSEDDHPNHARYAWRSDGAWHELSLEATGEAALPAPGSDAAFITEHYWGYTRQRDGGTIEYQVLHPTWRLRRASAVQVSGDMAKVYGGAFGEILTGQPASAFLAEGSAVSVWRPVRVA
jgi:uncharacterized protein YqjF (DUF2071 family)